MAPCGLFRLRELYPLHLPARSRNFSGSPPGFPIMRYIADIVAMQRMNWNAEIMWSAQGIYNHIG